MIILSITPVPKPRQTRADVWKKRPAVMRYRAFADEVRLKLPSYVDLNCKHITFFLPMPKSWSNLKKIRMQSTPHKQKPDLDNLLKALLDAHMSDDSGIHRLGSIAKVWSTEGAITIDGGGIKS